MSLVFLVQKLNFVYSGFCVYWVLSVFFFFFIWFPCFSKQIYSSNLYDGTLNPFGDEEEEQEENNQEEKTVMESNLKPESEKYSCSFSAWIAMNRSFCLCTLIAWLECCPLSSWHTCMQQSSVPYFLNEQIQE